MSYGVVVCICLALFFPTRADAQPAPVCRVSVENPTTHFQALAARRFAEVFAEKTRGSVAVEFYDGARLFRDTDALGALARGQVEVIFPGIWQLDRHAPDVAALMLPTTYGRSVAEMRSLVDGAFGDALADRIEAALGAVRLGRWLDAGHAHIFTLAPTVRSAKDIAGKRIRVAGGRGNEERIAALGARALSIPLFDLVSYLDGRLVDGILSTYEAVDSARLDRNGIKAVFEDAEYYPFYVPLASRRFWDSLDDAQRTAAREAWAEVVARGREDAVRSHAEAKARLVARGLVVYAQADAERDAVRENLLPYEADMARKLNISAETLRTLRDSFRGRP